MFRNMEKDYANMTNLKKTGENKFSGFKYYELADFTPTIIKLCNEVGLFTKFTFDNETATLEIINSDKQEQKEIYTSPMRNLQLKGCNDIQALGGVETYSRRYLYMCAFDIVENDMFDGNVGKREQPPQNQQVKVVPIQPSQIEIIKKYYKDDNLTKLLEANNLAKLEDMDIKKASEIIVKLKKKAEEGKNE